MFYEFKHPVTADYFRLEQGSGFSFPAHLHHCFEFLYVPEGEMAVTLDDRLYTVHAGEGMLFFPNQIHAMSTPMYSRHVLCLFAPDLVSAYTKSVVGRVPENSLFLPPPYLIAQLDLLETQPNRFSIKGFLYALCGSFDAGAHYHPATEGEGVLLRKIFLFIEQNYTGDCSLSALAAHLGYDYAYLSRYFHKSVGMSYNEYLNQYRVSRVCYLLQNTEKTILEIAGECGFNSLRSLNRNFRAQLGVPPHEYRKQ